MRRLTLPFIVAISLFSVKSNAQVGINTSTPTSTLDVIAKNATGSASNVDGLLVPRVDRLRAQSMSAVPTSTMIYINNAATGTQLGTTVNVDTVGYYYFNGTAWVKIKSTDTTDLNIYNSNGSLTGNRIVTQGANTLAFTGTVANAFSVDGSTFSVDAANDRVGIGTIAPENRFQVVSTGAVSNRYTLFDAPSSTNQLAITSFRNTSPVATGNYALLGFTNAGPTSGGATWGMGSVRTGNTGVSSEEEFFLGNSLGGGYLERMRITSAGRVGIGTSTPSASAILDVASTSAGLLMPRMTSGQMNAITTPVAGLQVYNTDENCTFLYNGSNWRSLCTRTFQQSAGGAQQVIIGGASVDLSQTISLAGTQNVTIHVSFNPQTFTNGVDANTVGNYQILIDGVSVAGSMRYSTQNAGNFLFRYSSVGDWTTTLAPGNHTIVFRVTATGGSVNTNAEDRRMIITVN